MSIISKEHIAELKITMHDAQGVQVAYTFHNLAEIIHCFVFFKSLSWLDVAVELSTFAELQHYVDLLVIFKDSFEVENVIMFECLVNLHFSLAAHFDFIDHPLCHFLLLQEIFVHHLHCVVLTRQCVLGLIDAWVCSLSQWLQYLVVLH